MGLLYNTKKKTDLVVLSEEKLENNEGELASFVILPADSGQEESEPEAGSGLKGKQE